MNFTRYMQGCFLSGDRARGRSYVRRVFDIAQNGNDVVFDVEGSTDDYEVRVRLDRLSASGEGIECSCPRYAGGYNCKHIWAALLILDQQSHLSPPDLAPVSGSDGPFGRNRRGEAAPSSLDGQLADGAMSWQRHLDTISRRFASVNDRHPHQYARAVGQREERLIYLIDIGRQRPAGGFTSNLVLSILVQERQLDGEWGTLKRFLVSRDAMDEKHEHQDKLILQGLYGAKPAATPYDRGIAPETRTQFEISPDWPDALTTAIDGTGRFFWTLGAEHGESDLMPAKFDRSGPFAIACELNEVDHHNAAEFDAYLFRGDERISVQEIVWIADNGLALLAGRIVVVSNPEAAPFIRAAQQNDRVRIAAADRDAFLFRLTELSNLPSISLPASWGVEQVATPPRGELRVYERSSREQRLDVELSFRYGDVAVRLRHLNRYVYDDESRNWCQRDLAAERALLDQIRAVPLIVESRRPLSSSDFTLQSKDLAAIVSTLGDEGWTIFWEGQPIRRPGVFGVTVNSGSDWFDLEAHVDFEGESVALPELLTALREKRKFVTLADGSRGQIPSELLARYARLAEFGEVHDDGLRFRPTQALLLDAMLSSQEHVAFDAGYRRFQQKLRRFDGIEPRKGPRGFQGELRAYQQAGLGWLHFLRDFGFGGCLADDMGLGKTVQVLALLESRRTRRLGNSQPRTAPRGKRLPRGNGTANQDTKRRPHSKGGDALRKLVVSLPRKPSIVVVPKSLVFNWIEEAGRFTPRLRLLNYTGTDRNARVAECDGFDVLVTTYGTLRRDITQLAEIQFDYAILDESSAIKNASAQSSKASRLLVADHRLAMTGTPIENHVGELWSLFEFLNPGMLGQSRALAALTARRSNREENEQALEDLSKGLRPFILRRTKNQVLDDLPAKTEQTLYCDMLPPQRKQYDELRKYYRARLSKTIQSQGIKRSKLQVLEALLRLRQVACDPRLLDASAKPGAKTQLLQQQLTDVVEEGHKILVFSQFTTLLSLVKAELDRANVVYEYLDGKTTNRGARVQRFQTDADVRVFLISLKAGGHGLNLTAADYVYLLDPWWNPAVESQAIDRAHRMGQQRPVVAYRIICRDTVEEKILELQETKRELADRIITADESMIRTLSAEDLELLLS